MTSPQSMSNETEAKERDEIERRIDEGDFGAMMSPEYYQGVIDGYLARAARPLPVEALNLAVLLIQSQANRCEYRDTKAKYEGYAAALRALLEAK